jgi:tetratricopeptide (TPR) repeat protein
MPVTVYMQRHPRHDHGFTIPDPLLTIENGTPHACNRCHTDRDERWSLAAVEKWYGEKMNRPSRARARTVAAGRAGDPGACDSLLVRVAGEKSAYWRAVAAGLLEAWTAEARVVEALMAAARDESPLVRAAAARSLEPAIADPASPARTVVWAMREDPDRGVRVAAAWSLRRSIDPASDAGRDLLLAIDANLDHPDGRMRRAVWHLSRDRVAAALADYERAVAWDPFSPPFRHDYAVALAGAGRHDEALAQLEKAVTLAPREAAFRFSLALALAERGSIERAIAELETVVREAPDHARAWYNLGLARAERGDTYGALEALREAERAEPRDPRAPYARATIHMRRGESDEARRAAQRALEIAPDFEEARRLLAGLGG